MSFSIQDFQAPPVEYRPWTRWWWPGGDVERAELLRELRLLSEKGFGGAEIQPFTAGMNPKTYNDPDSRVNDYGSAAYYEKLTAVLATARELGIQIDLTLGSGWPAGGEFVPLEDNVDTLLYGEMMVTGAVRMPLPAPVMPFAYAIFSPSSVLPFLMGREWTRTLTYHPELAHLITVVAAKISQYGRSPDPSVLTDTLHLDVETATDIGDCVRDGVLEWEPPSPGDWQIIALYTMPSGSHTLISAGKGERYGVDPFDSSAISRYYENWLGAHPELLTYAGTTLRALFSDSYEYFPQRHFADDLLSLFRERRGYDVRPLLPAVFQPGRDQHFFFFTGLRTASDFSFGEVSKRIIYDYDLTVSDLFFKHWYPVSRMWAEQHGLQFRQQGYNPPLDVIKAAGAAHIPETEGGNELLLKRVASGGHLYGRPIISAEAFVFFPQGGYALTPQDYKQGIDVLMTSGVNHIIYHGTPYRWDEPGYGETNWSPFMSPYGGVNITSNISEADAFWKYQQTINDYAARLQVLLRQGAPDADLLVYLPLFHSPDDARFSPALQAIDTSGYRWEWVNDELIAQAEWTGTGLQVGSMMFQGIVLPNVQALPVPTAEHLARLAQAGAPILIYGERPSQQPGYFDYEANDRLVADRIETIVTQANSAHLTESSALEQSIQQLPGGMICLEPNRSLRTIGRNLGDSGHLTFIRNTGEEAVTFTLRIDPTLTSCYWLDAMRGTVYAANDGRLTGWLPGFGAIAILASPEPLFADDELTDGNPVLEPVIVQRVSLADWTLEVDGAVMHGAALCDWKLRDDLKFVSSVGRYATSITLSDIDRKRRYVLNLGVVHSAADVMVNGQAAGQAIFAPYQVDVTPYLKAGDNHIQVEVTPVLRNRLLGKALSGDPEYVQYIRGLFANPNPVSSGLVGPVSLDIVGD
jgi:hypothetical protein